MALDSDSCDIKEKLCAGCQPQNTQQNSKQTVLSFNYILNGEKFKQAAFKFIHVYFIKLDGNNNSSN